MKKHFAIVSLFLLALGCSHMAADSEGDQSKRFEKTHERHNHPYHKQHAHLHNSKCGHKAVKHEDHVDYEHNGHFHHQVGKVVHECKMK